MRGCLLSWPSGQLEVEVFHERRGVVVGDGILEDDGDASTLFVVAVSVYHLVAFRSGGGDVGVRGGVKPRYGDEGNVHGEGGDVVPDFRGVFAEGAGVEQDTLEQLWGVRGLLGGSGAGSLIVCCRKSGRVGR